MEFLFALFLVMALALYCLPAVIATKRKTRYRTYIMAINILLGWTVLGWLAALLWAVLEERDEEERRIIRLRESEIVEINSEWTL
jgi:nitric oxide reductase large subunit